MYKLVLIRHGESQWNSQNRFTGWVDVDLSDKGVAEAHKAGQTLKKEGFVFDIAYTSVLKRAIKTLDIVLDEMDLMWIPVHKSWRLNERHYGALQGLNKAEMAKQYGEEQVLIWRRSYSAPPPILKKSDEYYPGNDPRYADLSESEIPLAECLKDTYERFIPLWHETIAPMVKSGKKVVIAAHGNSLRALIKFLDDMSEDAILQYNVPTGLPLVYYLDEKLKPVKSYYLGDPEEVKKAMEQVANQGKAR